MSSDASAGPRGARPRVVILRGHQANPWELRPWEHPRIAERFAVSYLRSRRGWFDTGSLSLEGRTTRTMRDLLPPGALGDLAVRVPGDRYLGLHRVLSGADIVHAQELGYWYSMQAAKLRRRMNFRLVLTVWETIPLLGAYRNLRTRSYRELTLAQTDLFLAATERARESLLLEGAHPDRIRVCPPGVSPERFSAHVEGAAGAARVIVSAGRLVWEKGHQDVLRALALLRRRATPGAAAEVRVLIVGTGPEEGRLRTYARELGVADAVEFRGFIPYEEMPAVYSGSACLVLASLPTWSWEEQFGMVLAEAMSAGTAIVASTSGAIPEVAGGGARYFPPGDWIGLANLLEEALAAGGGEQAERRRSAAELSGRYSVAQAGERLAAAYEEVLASAVPARRAAASSS